MASGRAAFIVVILVIAAGLWWSASALFRAETPELGSVPLSTADAEDLSVRPRRSDSGEAQREVAGIGDAAVLLGRAVTPEGIAVSGAHVHVDALSGARRGQAETAPDGTFSVALLSSDESVLRLRTPGFASRAVPLSSMEGRREHDVGDVVLHPSQKVRVDVVVASGHPLAGAVVRLVPEVLPPVAGVRHGRQFRSLFAPRSPVEEARSDSSGRCHFADVAVGRYFVEAVAPGHAWRSSRTFFVVAGAAPPRVRLLLEKSVVTRLRVVDEAGEGIAGARLGFRREMHAVGRDRFETDQEGAFETDVLALARYSLSIEADGFAPFMTAHFRVGAASGSETITLTRGIRLEGTLRMKASREPIGGARVLATTVAGASVEGVADEHGRFSLGGVPREPGVSLTAELSGHHVVPLKTNFMAGAVVIDTRESGDPQTVDLWMRRDTPIEGRVVDGDGEGVAGADISIEMPHGVRSCLTDGDGRFRGEVSGPTKVRFVTRKSGFALHEMTTTLTEQPQEITIKLQRGVPISGRVVGPGGRPVAGAGIRLSESRRGLVRRVMVDIPPFVTRAAHEVDAHSDADGLFEVTCASRERDVTLHVMHPDWVDRDIVVLEAERENPVLIQLDAAATIRGTVVMSDGSSPTGVKLSVHSRGEARHPWPDPPIVVGEDGRFTVTGLAPGHLFVRLMNDREDFLSIEERPGVVLAAGEVRETTVSVKVHAVIKGRLLGRDGRPIAGATVTAARSTTLPKGGRRNNAKSTTAEDGRFQLGPLDRDGRYDIRTKNWGFAVGPDGEREFVEFSLPAGRREIRGGAEGVEIVVDYWR